MKQLQHWRAEGLGQDVRYAVRRLTRQPGLLAVAVLTLGLGVGANVAMFGIADVAVFRALPFPEADQLVLARATLGLDRPRDVWTSSWPDFEDYRDGTQSFVSLAAMAPISLDRTLEGIGEPERVRATWVTPGFFRTLGVPMATGREFLPEENRENGPRVAILSHRLWRSRLAGREDVVGSRVVLDGVPHTVVGVAPPDYTFVVEADVWMPVVQAGWGMARQSNNWLVLGRLASGVTLTEAQAEVDVVARRLQQEYPASNQDKGLRLTGLQETVVEWLGPLVFGLWVAVGLVLLIACANVASLLLARGAARRQEMATRAALGADGSRLARQLLVEHALMGLGAAAVGAVLALSVQRLLMAASPLGLLGIRPAIHPESLAFAVALAVATVLLFGLPPALIGSRVRVVEGLKTGPGSTTGGPGRLQGRLLMVQVALGVVLLLAAGLLLANVTRLRNADPGFITDRVLTADVALPEDRYPEGEQRARFFDDLVDRVEALPDVAAAGLVSRIPIRDFGDKVGVWDPREPPARPMGVDLAFQRMVGPGYFDALGIPILAGRAVRASDGPATPPVLVVNRRLAETLFPGEDAVGRSVTVDLAGDTLTSEVVGVVGDVRIASLAGESDLAMYFPYRQRPVRTMGLVVRTRVPPSTLVASVRDVLRSLDARVPLGRVATMDSVLSGSLALARVVMVALGLFALVALALVTLGLYGLLSYQVARRQHEIGVRMALGAASGDVVRLVLRRGLGLVGAGILIGAAVLGLAALAGPAPALPFRASDPTMTFRLEADPLALATPLIFLLVVATAACLRPALRALRVDPITALKSE